jgi:hypothetical protein
MPTKKKSPTTPARKTAKKGASKKKRAAPPKKRQPAKKVEAALAAPTASPVAAFVEAHRDEAGKFKPGHGFGFKPGQSGNPAGRPKCRTLSEAYRQRLAEEDPNDPLQRTFAEKIAESQIDLAASQELGSTSAAKEIGDRTEGKPFQSIAVIDPDREAKRLYYEHLIEQVGIRWQEEAQETPTREQVIIFIAGYKSEILTFFPIRKEQFQLTT